MRSLALGECCATQAERISGWWIAFWLPATLVSNSTSSHCLQWLVRLGPGWARSDYHQEAANDQPAVMADTVPDCGIQARQSACYSRCRATVRCTKARSTRLLNSACQTTSRNWPGVICSRIRRYVRQPQGGCLECATAFQVQLLPVQEMPCDVSAVRLHRPRPLHLLVPKPATVTPRTQGPAVTCDNGLRVRGTVC